MFLLEGGPPRGPGDSRVTGQEFLDRLCASRPLEEVASSRCAGALLDKLHQGGHCRTSVRSYAFALRALYHHNRTGEDNADAHLKRQVMGRILDHHG